MKTLFILNDAPYGSERTYNGVRLAGSLSVMLDRVARNGSQIGACGTCMDARGTADTELIEGIGRSTMAELTASTQWADKVVVF